ncbi:uncharacterized protein [Dermacentor albipictus]|uniref:uncharacterized protein n=1 Tax=Dermacentor albipictus TaxID=60249 RepID=UPI0038FC4586
MASSSPDQVLPSAPLPRNSEVTALKLVELWSSYSEVWFIVIESLFRRHRLSSQMDMFDHVVGALPPITAVIVRDLLCSWPVDHPYEYLKLTLNQGTTETEQHRLQQLHTLEELSDRKLCDLLRRMQALAGVLAPSTDRALLQQLFLQCLPPLVRTILTASLFLTLESLAESTDRIKDVRFVRKPCGHS